MTKAAKKFWSFKAKEDSKAELLLYGVISSTSWWGDEITPKQFKTELDALGDVNELSVFINSDGGDVFAGQAIHSMLKRHTAKVTVYIDGLAASIASVIAMAGDTIIMPRNAMMMVHNPWTIAMGNAGDFRKMADDLDQARESMVVTYESKTGLPRDKIIELLDAETWMTADEAVNLGFADELEKNKTLAASLDGTILSLNSQDFDLSKFKNPPKVAAILPIEPEVPKAKDEQTETGLLSLYQKLSQVNKNRIRR